MAFKDKYTTSVHGRRLGLQAMSTPETGSNHGRLDFVVGPEEIRVDVTTDESTGTNLKPFGVSVLPGTSAASSCVYTIDPPIPGVRKYIVGTTANGPFLVKTANNEQIFTTAGTSFTTVEISSIGGGFEMVGLTTAIWLGLNLTSGTSSNASGFSLTTST